MQAPGLDSEFLAGGPHQAPDRAVALVYDGNATAQYDTTAWRRSHDHDATCALRPPPHLCFALRRMRVDPESYLRRLFNRDQPWLLLQCYQGTPPSVACARKFSMVILVRIKGPRQIG